MPDIKSDLLFTLGVALTLIAIFTGIGFVIGQSSRTPTTPTPAPSPTPELKAGISDYANLFAKIDDNLFPPEQYHSLLTRFADCLPTIAGQPHSDLLNKSLSEGESTALIQFMTSLTLMIATFGNPPSPTIHQTLTTTVSECP